MVVDAVNAAVEWFPVFGGVPLAWVEVACDDDLGVVDADNGPFALNVERVYIQNAEKLSEGNLTREFVQYDDGLICVSIPPALVSDLRGEGDGEWSLRKSSSGLSGTGGPPVDDNTQLGADLGRETERAIQSATAGKLDKGLWAKRLRVQEPTLVQCGHKSCQVGSSALVALGFLVDDDASVLSAVVLGFGVSDCGVLAHLDVSPGEKH